jgi:hypothetical protein
VPALQPRHDRAHERGERRTMLVDRAVLVGVRKVEARDALPHRLVEELEPRRDEALHRAAVEPREARQLVVVGEVEHGHDRCQHLRVLGADAVVGGRRQPHLAVQPAQERGRAPDARRDALVRRRDLLRLGEEERERKRELARRHSARDVVERDAGRLERLHQSDDVHIGERVAALAVRLEDAEVGEPHDPLDRARHELGEPLRGDRRHRGDCTAAPGRRLRWTRRGRAAGPTRAAAPGRSTRPARRDGARGSARTPRSAARRRGARSTRARATSGSR